MSDSAIHADIRPTSEERTWALVAHVGGPIGVIVSAGLLGFLAPLVVWLAKRDESEFAADQGKEALNFQLTLFCLYLAGLALILVTLGIGALIVIPAYLVLVLAELVLGIVAALRAYDGQRYRYPFSIRFL